MSRDAKAIYKILTKTYPNVRCELDFKNPLQLVVASVLSAQCTDKRVNQVTPALFKKYKTARDYGNANIYELEDQIRSIGLFRAKARNIKGLGMMIDADYNGKVPGELKELVRLPGVGRKTANVILNTIFNEPAIAVDTHIFRISNRINIAPGENVLQVEKKLMKVTPKEFLKDAHHLLILHGRYTCTARLPKCSSCVINDLCEYKKKIIN